MTFGPPEAATALAGVMFFALGAYGIRVAKGNRLASRFAAWCMWMAAFYVFTATNLSFENHATTWTILAILVYGGVSITYFRFVLQSLQDYRPVPKRFWIVTVTYVAILIGSELIGRIGEPGLSIPASAFVSGFPLHASVVALVLAFASSGILTSLHPLIALNRPKADAVLLRRAAVFSFGLSCLPAGSLAFLPVIFNQGNGYSMIGGGGIILLNVLPVLLWGLAMRGAHPRLARTMVLLLLSVNLLGALLASTSPAVAYGVFRILGASSIAYFALGGNVPGFEAKLRFGVSKSTIAAVFVAAFFIASEAAQAFFGDRFQNEYFGIAAAGLLVFAIAPLMRWSDRIATAAVPMPHGPADMYREALRVALSNGRIDVNEERVLAVLADRLSLSATQTFEIRQTLPET